MRGNGAATCPFRVGAAKGGPVSVRAAPQFGNDERERGRTRNARAANGSEQEIIERGSQRRIACRVIERPFPVSKSPL